MSHTSDSSGFFSQRCVLVTGAGGFIGSHLVETLAQKGARVRAFVRYTSRADLGQLVHLRPETLDLLEIFPGDLRELDTVNDAVHGMDFVFHLGALIAIPYSYKHPAEVVETNVIGTLNVLLAAREQHVERVVHTSSSEVYGTALRVPINEKHPLQGQSPYSASKIGADKLAESFYCAYHLPVVTLRPFNTYGPRQSNRAVIPTIISQALTRKEVFLGNLEAKRDFTFISDTVEGFLRAASTPNIEGRTFNLGVGTDISIGELAHLIISLVGKPVHIKTDQQRLRPEKSEVQRLISENSLARECLGWIPRVTLKDGLVETIHWISENIRLYRPNQYQV